MLLFRTCLCIYKDPKNLDRFTMAIQLTIHLCVAHLKTIQTTLKDPQTDADATKNDAEDVEAGDSAGDSNLWSQEETERMLQFLAKVRNLFFSPTLPLASTRWAQLTISRPCPLF